MSTSTKTKFQPQAEPTNRVSSLGNSLEEAQQGLSHANAQVTRALAEYGEVVIDERFEKSMTSPLLSFVIPAMDEQETVAELCYRIIEATPADYQIEIIWVDDGSKDKTWQKIQELSKCDALGQLATVRGIRFRHNAGKAAALMAGFRAAKGDLVFTMDADLQDDPQEIPKFIEAIENGFDVATGWKKKRHDPWHKVLPSRIFNWMLSRATGVKLHDHNCGFKCYRKVVAKTLVPYGELHRMMPCLAAMHGFRTTEIEVQHHARVHGQSKYGLERFARGFSDMLTVSFLKRFGERPSHFFNCVVGLMLLLAMSLAVGALVVGITSVQGCLLGTAAVLLGVMMMPTFLSGLLAEMIILDGRMTNRELPIAEQIGKTTPSPAS